MEVNLSNFNSSVDKKKYGDVVKLQRTITKTTSSMKVWKNDGWKPVKRAELDSILRSFKIHLDNPVQVLTQKLSTNFLSTQDPEEM